jgi:hypothetical protein
MKYIKTFESFSPVSEEIDFKKIMRGGTTVKMTPENFEKLKAKYCNVVTDGKTTKATKESLFTIEGDEVKGTTNAMKLYNSMKSVFKMDMTQALTATMGVYDWNGFTQVDPKESNFDANKKEFSVVKAQSTRGSGFNTN